MFSLKISYKGKNILLGKGITSLKKIDQELGTRFPGQFLHGALLKYQDNIIAQFDQIEAIASTLPNKSIKLEAEQAPEIKKQSIIKQEPKQQINQKEETKIVEVKQTQQIQHKVEDEKKVEQMQNLHEQGVLLEKISIDSQSSDGQHEKEQKIKQIDEQIHIQIKQKPQEVKIQTDQKVENIKDQVAINDPTQVKCTIYNEVPIQEQVKPEIVKCSIFGEEQQNKPDIIKCQIFRGEEPSSNTGQNFMGEPDVVEPGCVQGYQGDQIQPEFYDESLQEIKPGVYRCIFCRFPFQNCYVCGKSRQINQNSKIMKLVNKIVQNKIHQKITQLQNKFFEKIKSFQKVHQAPIPKVQEPLIELPKPKEELKKQKSIQEKRQILKKSSCEIIDHLGNKKQVLLGQSFEWTFDIKFKQLQNSQNVCILDQKYGEVIKTEVSKQNTIKVGPFKATHEGRFDRTYRLCFMNPDQTLEMFGPKFGFSVMVAKPKNTKILSNAFRIHIQQLKKGYKIERSVQYLIQKLKQLGINEQNFEESKEFLPDIIQTV